MENAMLILSATVWRVVSYILRGLALGLSTVYADDSLLYLCFLYFSITLFFLVSWFTLRFSELNAMSKPANPIALRIATVLDSLLWVFSLITLGMGLFNVTVL